MFKIGFVFQSLEGENKKAQSNATELPNEPYAKFVEFVNGKLREQDDKIEALHGVVIKLLESKVLEVTH